MGILIENRSASFDQLIFVRNIGASVDTLFSTIIDTAAYDAGVTFIPHAFVLTFPNVLNFGINESDESDMADATPIDDNRLTNPLSDLSKSSVDIEGAQLSAMGVFNTKRFIQLTMTPTTTDGGEFIVTIRAIEENKPVSNDVLA